MRTIKNVTLASNKTGKRLFVQKGSAGSVAEDFAVKSAGEPSKQTVGVLGNRTGNTSSDNYDRVESPLDKIKSNKVLRDKASRRLDTIDPYSSEAVELSAIIGSEDTTTVLDRHNRAVETADELPAMGSNAGGLSGNLPSSSTVTDVVTRGMLINVIDDIIYDKNPYRANIALNRILRDMFYHDSTTGSAVNLLSTLPFSEFSLSGLKDEKMTSVFVDSLESMKINALLPNMSIDYLVVGSAIVSLTYDEKIKRFTGSFPHNIDFAYFIQVPSYGIDPIIKVRLEPHIAGALENPTIKEKYLQYIPKQIVDFYSKGGRDGKGGGDGFELDPKTSIFIARNGTLRDFRGISLLKRAIPAWLYEKALIKGTLDQSYKRQRPIMHVTAGEGEEWVPVTEEMQAISNMFLAADLDPLGAIVVTRQGVNVNEVRSGQDFWRWDQNYDAIERIKLRSIGISESFVAGDAAYNSLEQTISVFMDQIRAYRNQFTSEIFYEKIFPMISEANGITKQRYGIKRDREVASYGNTRIYRDEDNQIVASIGNSYPQVKELGALSKSNVDVSRLVVPEILWHKRLMPEADEAYINMLGALHEKGVPITIRQWTAAGGLNLDNLLEDLNEDLRVREQIVNYRKSITDLMKEAGMGSEEEDPGSSSQAFGEFASSSSPISRAIDQMVNDRFNIGSVRKRSILSYGNPDHPNANFTDYDSQGNRRVMTKQGRDIIANRFTKNLAKAAAEMAKLENKRTKEEEWQRNQRLDKKKYYHSK